MNQLANCYPPPPESGGGGSGDTREGYPQAHSPPYHRGYNNASYPAYGSPSPGAATGHNGNDYYGAPPPAMNTHRLSHPPIQAAGRERHSSPNHLASPGGGGGGMAASADNAIGATNPQRPQQNRSPEFQHQTSNTSTASSNYSGNNNNNNTSSSNNNNNSGSASSSSSGSQSGTELTALDSPPPRTNSVSSPESSSPPAAQQTSQVASSGGGGGGSGSEGDPTSPTQSPNSQPQIYPWMRRQHSAHGHGGNILCISLYLSSIFKILNSTKFSKMRRKWSFCVVPSRYLPCLEQNDSLIQRDPIKYHKTHQTSQKTSSLGHSYKSNKWPKAVGIIILFVTALRIQEKNSM